MSSLWIKSFSLTSSYAYKLLNHLIQHSKMGSQITIDKHTTSIDEWLEVSQKIEAVDFDEEVCNHLSVWKFYGEEVSSQEFSSLPMSIDLQTLHQAISPHETYIVVAIRNRNQKISKPSHPALSTLVYSIKQNIEQLTLQTSIVSQQMEQAACFVYAFLGKFSKPKLRVITLSYAAKMNGLINSKKKLAILSNGGVFKNKKLQKGSTLPLFSSNYASSKQLSDHEDIHIFKAYYQQQEKQSRTLRFTSKRRNPFIQCEDKPVSKVAGAKPPLLKLSLKPFQEVKYEQIEEQQKSGEIKFDIRATARHELKMQKFQGECSEIMQGLYVSGQKVAKSWQLLQKYKIKAIVNCAGDYCQNWFENKGINYLTFFLKDSQNQNIECLFYTVIDFILNCQKNKVNVLVHCIQGISRSITFIMAFLIFKDGFDYKKAEQFVKQRRGIACPNNGFMVELIQYYKRLYEDFTSLPIPRVFLVSSHSKQTPNVITARMIKHPLFDSRKPLSLDCRGVYIVQGSQCIYIWVGSRCQQRRLKNYWSFAQEYVKKLQKYEKGSLKVKAVSQGSQGKQFLALWNLQNSPQLYQNPEYTRLFWQGQPTKPGGMRKYYQKQIQQQHSTRLYVYPDDKQGLGVFQWQDLGTLNILASAQSKNLKIYICKRDGQEDEQKIGCFLDSIIRQHYSHYDSNQINIEQESTENPSQDFLTCFS